MWTRQDLLCFHATLVPTGYQRLCRLLRNQHFAYKIFCASVWVCASVLFASQTVTHTSESFARGFTFVRFPSEDKSSQRTIQTKSNLRLKKQNKTKRKNKTMQKTNKQTNKKTKTKQNKTKQKKNRSTTSNEMEEREWRKKEFSGEPVRHRGRHKKKKKKKRK